MNCLITFTFDNSNVRDP